ncbi:hypothetical protein ES705_08053 [subsurface metagenome]
MVNFCPKCYNLLRKKIMNGIYYLVCKCGYSEELVSKDREQNIKEIQKKKEALTDNFIVVSDKEKILIHPKTSKTCPKCRYNEAVFCKNKFLALMNQWSPFLDA